MNPHPEPLRRILALGALVFVLMVPETLPVPVLRALVLERYDVSDARASLFMAANMIGALLAAPLAGLAADRFGRRRGIVAVALALDAVCMDALAHADTFHTLLVVRCLEGACHITALSLVLALGADRAGPDRGRVLGMLGAGLTLGVATGAAIGGVVGRKDPVLTLHAASLLLALAAVLAILVLGRDPGAAARPSVRQIVGAITSHRAILPPLAISLVDRFVVGFYTTCFPLMLAGLHGTPRWQIGVLLGLFLYPFALLSYPFGRLAERRSPARFAALGSVLYGLATIAVGVVPPGVLWILMPILGVASALLLVPSMLLTARATPALARSTALAAFQAAGSLGFLLGPLAGSGIVAIAGSPERGYALAFAIAGATVLLSALALLPRFSGERATR